MNRSLMITFGGLVLVVIAAGCSSEDVNQFVDKTKESATQSFEQAKESATQGYEQAKETATEQTDKLREQAGQATTAAQEGLSLAGSMEIPALSAKTSGCYAAYVPATTNRPAFLQFRSYQSPEQESFPSMFLQGQVDVAASTELATKTIPMQMFVQVQPGGPILKSSEPVQVKVGSVDGKTINAEISAGTLLAVDGRSQAITGNLVGVLQ